MSNGEESGLLRTTGEAAQQATELENGASRFRAAASRVLYNGKSVAQRWGRQSLGTAGEWAGNATDHIKEDPLRAAAITFIIGLSLGVLIGWLSGRRQEE